MKFFFALLTVVGALGASPTDRFEEAHSIEEIRYFLRADKITFVYKDLFDRAIAHENQHFAGYIVGSHQMRVYQDCIRIIMEDILEISVPLDFHFLAVPGYPHHSINSLQEVPEVFFSKKHLVPRAMKRLLSFHPILYANYKNVGFCPAKEFTLNRRRHDSKDLYWLGETLGIDREVLDEAYAIGEHYLSHDYGLLMQIFDPDFEAIDRVVYPAYPSGHPVQNSALSDYLHALQPNYPTQFFLLLSDRDLLNPAQPIRFRRYSNVQTNQIKEYEQALRRLIRGAQPDKTKCYQYKEHLELLWK